MRQLPVASIRLAAHPASSRSARAFVTEHLRQWHIEPAIDDATLLVSELVTNATLTARGPLELVVRKARNAVRIEVFAEGRRAPPPAHPEVDKSMSLVHAMATRWGVDDVGTGRTVWFEIAL